MVTLRVKFGVCHQRLTATGQSTGTRLTWQLVLCNGAIIEDGKWLRDADDRKHIKPFKRIRDQLVMDNGELSRSFRLPAVGNMTVLIIPGSLIPHVVDEAHRMSEHGSWTVIYEMLRAICYFPGMNLRCQEFCHDWQACCAANGRSGVTVPLFFFFYY